MKATNTYRVMKGKAITPIFYLYIGNYSMGRVLGNILTFLVIASSIIIGKITENVVIDTVCYAASIGSLIYNYKILNLLYKGKSVGYFLEGASDEHFHTLKRHLGPMIMMSRFVELYTVFIITLIMPAMVLKLAISFMIIALTIIFKVKNNFIENKVSSIIKKNSISQIIIILIGLFISKRETVTIYNNLIIIGIALIIGIARYALSKKFKSFFKDELRNIKVKKIPMSVYRIGTMFNKEFLAKKGKNSKKEEKKDEKKEMKKTENSNEKKNVDWYEIYKKQREYDEWYDNLERKREAEFEARITERQEKERIERSYKAIEKKINKNESLSIEEKAIMQKSVEESQLPQNTDRTKIKR